MASKTGNRSTANLTEAQKEAKKKEREQAKVTRFTKLAPSRVNAVLKALDRVKALANKRSYTYSNEQGEKIAKAISESAEACKKAFTEGAGSAGFTL